MNCRRVAGCAVAVGILFAPVTASASSVQIESPGFLHFVGDPGESNVVTVAGTGGSYVQGQRVEGGWTVTDDGAELRAGPGCSSLDEHRATCRGPGVYSARFDLGDGPDQFTGAGRANGQDGDDVLNAGTDLAALDGGPGDDVVNGGPHNDNTLVGGPGDDQIDGGAGDDSFDQSNEPGSDVVRGGPGTDEVSYRGRAVGVRATLGSGTADDGEPGEHDDLGGDIEAVVGTDHADFIIGSASADSLSAEAGDDRVYGANGADTINGGLGADYVSGGNGSDRLGFGVPSEGDGSPDTFSGGAGVDAITYRFTSDEIHVSLNGSADDGAVGEGDNVLGDVENVQGGWSTNVLVGNDAPNVLEGADGGYMYEFPPFSDDNMYGGGGDDTLSGHGGADVLTGGPGDDTLDAAAYDGPYGISGDPSVDDVDYLYGGAGNDILFAHDFVSDRVDCGPGLVDLAEGDKSTRKDTFSGCELVLGKLTVP
jgi:Ca2+-binding RTX toxin-like protein